MIPSTQRLQRLSSEVQAQIRSAVQISSLSDVVLGLTQNSLDANANRISICLDFTRGYCSVSDDGDGILQDEFSKDGKLTQPYYTSRDPQSRTHYGRFGRFLSSLCGVSILSISSRHILEDISSSAVYKNGTCIATNADKDLLDTEHGTKVVVHDLFGKMPVRAKYRVTKSNCQSGHKEFEDLKRLLVGLILAAPRSFSLELADPTHRYKHDPRRFEHATFSVNRIVSTLHQAGMIESPDPTGWEKASAHTPDFDLKAVICLRPVPTKSKQFISLNQHPLPSHLAVFIDQINTIFDASSFGSTDCYKTKNGQDHGSKIVKGADRWPIFWITIRFNSLNFESAFYVQIDELINSICNVLRTLVAEFLQCHGFTNLTTRNPKPRREQVIVRPSSLDSWSRMKSTGCSSGSFLTGLPFMSSNHIRHTPNSQVFDVSDAVSTEDSNPMLKLIKWADPRTGQLLSVDPKTGMTLSPRILSSQRLRSSKQLSDVADTLSSSKPTTVDSEKVPTGNHVCTYQSDFSMQVGPSGDTIISKESLRTVNILGQADRKFILATLQNPDGNAVLISIDQHAADERIKFEQLLKKTRNITPILPIVFHVTQEEANMFQQLQDYFRTLGIQYTTNDTNIKVATLPESIAEKCRLQPKLIVDLLRKEIWQDHKKVNIDSHDHWLSETDKYPQSILDMLASRACRSAIMFNDSLTRSQCRELVQRLCDCSFPFQCAHGRPSLTVLAKIRNRRRTQQSFGERWRAWVL